MKQNKNLHYKEMKLSANILKDQLHQQRSYHHAQQAMAKEMARRENLRDIWVQISGKSQSLMVIATLMFACGFSILVEGMPPIKTKSLIVFIFSSLIGISLSALLLSVWFSMNEQARMSNFNMYNRKQLYRCGQIHERFEAYYDCHCRLMNKLAEHMFYLGTVCLMLAAAIVIYERLTLQYNNVQAGYSYSIIAFVSLIIIWIFHLIYPTKTRLWRTEDGEFHQKL